MLTFPVPFQPGHGQRTCKNDKTFQRTWFARKLERVQIWEYSIMQNQPLRVDKAWVKPQPYMQKATNPTNSKQLIYTQSIGYIIIAREVEIAIYLRRIICSSSNSSIAFPHRTLPISNFTSSCTSFQMPLYCLQLLQLISIWLLLPQKEVPSSIFNLP